MTIYNITKDFSMFEKINNNDALECTIKCISLFVKLFQRNTYGFLYESDIQGMLFAQLRQALPQTIEIKGSGKPLNDYKIPIVNTGYLSKIDIVCLDVESSENQDTRVHKGKDLSMYNLPVQIGVEIKYRKQGDSFDYKCCVDDLNKLKALPIKTPVVLCFIQNKKDVVDFLSDSSKFSSIELSELPQNIEKGMVIISSDSIWVYNS